MIARDRVTVLLLIAGAMALVSWCCVSTNTTLLLAPTAAAPLAALEGNFTGTTICDRDARVGTLSAVFRTQGNGQAIDGDLTWTSPQVAPAIYTAKINGTLDNMTIVAVSAPSGCNYKGSGALSSDGNRLSGPYSTTGSGACRAETGTFALTRTTR